MATDHPEIPDGILVLVSAWLLPMETLPGYFHLSAAS
jgi:hypothetical protein